MDYIEISFETAEKEPYMFDLLADTLAEAGFESFLTEGGKFRAFIAEKHFAPQKLNQTLQEFDFADFTQYQTNQIAAKNWNQEWEKNFFEPIVVGDKCVIHSSFHRDVPKADYDIVINPKMAFGTGHHATTQLMLEYIFQTDFQQKQLLDIGCGTAVLTIAAMMCGAKAALAVDIDDWCVANSLENLTLNHITNVEVLLGDADVLKNRKFDIILANINRNILLADMQQYVACMNTGGLLFLSGFYAEDVPVLLWEAEKHGLQRIETKQKAEWCALKLLFA